MKIPAGYRLIRIDIHGHVELNAVFLTDISSSELTRIVQNSPGTAIDELIKSKHAFLIDIDPIDEIYIGIL